MVDIQQPIILLLAVVVARNFAVCSQPLKTLTTAGPSLQLVADALATPLLICFCYKHGLSSALFVIVGSAFGIQCLGLSILRVR